jgi:hypothetical protein
MKIEHPEEIYSLVLGVCVELPRDDHDHDVMIALLG